MGNDSEAGAPVQGTPGHLTLDEVMGALYEVRAKWYYIGLGLRLPVRTLYAIDLKFTDSTDCLTEMCREWLRRINPRPSWATLIEVLESRPVGEGHLAQQLRDKYCQGEEELISHVYPIPRPLLTSAPPTSQGQLTLEDLSEVTGALYEVHAKWYNIGLELRLPVGTLNAIRFDFIDPTACLTEMCSQWLRRIIHPSWATLIEVLESPRVGEGHLAQQLRDKYCQGEEELIPNFDPTPGPSLTGAPPTPQDDKLTPHDLGHVLEEVIETAAHWYTLGLQLRVTPVRLDRIRTQFSHPRDQLRMMLETWLQTGFSTSWKTLINALGFMGESQLAQVLKTKYCLVEKTEVDSSCSDSQPEADVTSPPVFHVVVPTVVVDMVETPLDQILATIPLQYQPLLEQKVSDLHLTVIVRTLTDWSLTCADLGITEAEEEVIANQKRNIFAKRVAVLQTWRQKNGPTATYRNLAKCSYNAGKPDLVEVVCKLLGAPSGLVVRQSASLQASSGEDDTPRDIEISDTSHSSHPMSVQDTIGYLLAGSADPNVQGLARHLPQRILQGKINSDSQGHVRQLEKWKQWADTNAGMDVFPVKPSHLCQYLTHLVDTDGHEAALADVSEAITWVHSLAGYISPVTDPRVGTLLTQLQEILHQLGICDHLMRDKETLEFTLMQCMFVGLPRAGKSSLMRRLMGEQPLIHSSSTGVVDEAKKVIVIEIDTENVEYATAQVLGMVWEKLMFDDEAVMFLQDMVRTFQSPNPTSESGSSIRNEKETESQHDSDAIEERSDSTDSIITQAQHDQDYAPMDPF